MNMTVLDRSTSTDQRRQSHLGFIDCDVHPYVKGPNDFDPFLSKRWLEHKQTIGGRTRQGLAKTSMYPRMSPGAGHARWIAGRRPAATPAPTCR